MVSLNEITMAEYSKEYEDDQIDPLKLLEVQFEEAECLTPYMDDSFDESENILSDDLQDESEKSKPRIFQCDKCPQIFKNEHYFLSHMEIFHNSSYTVPFKCKLCSKVMTTQIGVNKHITRHLESPEKACPGCGKEFYVMARLRHHLKACLQTLSELCTYCGVRFNYASSLRRHIRTMHCKDKDYECKECGKTFKLSRYLKRHEIIHTSLKPFRCKYCDRDFNRSANLEVHIRLHTGVKPYRCDICGVAFTHNVSCKKHRLKHFADTV